jgi:DNA-binding response OmpR family regulator
MQFLLRNLFTDAGFKVNSIMDGKELVDHKDVAAADLIILDMMIPNVYDSSSLIDAYKDHKSPIIVVSSIDEEDGLYFSKKIGAQAFFSKPFDSAKLLSKVEQLLASNINKEVISN